MKNFKPMGCGRVDQKAEVPSPIKNGRQLHCALNHAMEPTILGWLMTVVKTRNAEQWNSVNFSENSVGAEAHC